MADSPLDAADAAWEGSNPAAASMKAGRCPLPFLWANEVNPPIDTGDFVEDLFVAGQLSVAFGGPGAGKSFLLIDCALHLAMGWEWFGRAVERSAVVYCAGEGGTGIERRITAWRRHHSVNDAERIPLALIRSGLDLRTGRDDTEALIETVRAVEAASCLPVRLVVIDTLARVIAGGDENTATDMGALVLNFDRIRDATGTHLCAVHHTGKDSSKGARGHISLKCAIDTEIEISRDDAAKVSTVKITKQRDLELGPEFSFRLQQIDLGTNARGKAVTSCVVEPSIEPVTKAKRQTLTAEQSLALAQLQKAIDEVGIAHTQRGIPVTKKTVTLDEWKGRCISSGLLDRDSRDASRQQWKRLKDALQNKGMARIWEELVWIP